MKFHGAWIHPDDDKVAVTFTAFDDTAPQPAPVSNQDASDEIPF